MTRFEALVGLNMVADIGSVRLKRLLDYFARPENVFEAPADKLIFASGIGWNIAQNILAFDKRSLDRELASAKKLSLDIITFEDEEYPENLKNIPAAPIVLYVKGKISPNDKAGIAIVGSRRASFYGLTNAEKFAYSLSERGLTVVSGMARGVDSAAHKGALKAGGRTLAVMGSGFRHIYPPENVELVQEVSRNGAVVSEFPLDVGPLRQNFPRRNRVISGLSLGVLVIEAASNSGALITADFALEQGREVFALPGEVDSNTSFGTNGLIKQGAKLVSCVDDILEEFDPNSYFSPSTEITEPKEDDSVSATQYVMPHLSDTENILYNFISDEPVQLDEIVEKTNLSISSISDILLRLQLKKMIRQLPGKQFARRYDER